MVALSVVVVLCLLLSGGIRVFADSQPTSPATTTTAEPPDPPPTTTTTTEDPGSYTVEAKGSLQWKETITVTKSKGGNEIKRSYTRSSQPEDKRDHHHHNGFIPKCCNAPSNKTNDIDFESRRTECMTQLEKVLGRKVTSKLMSKDDYLTMNCFLQCTSRKFGLSEDNGSIKPKEMTDYTMADSKMIELGITSEMVNACVITSKGNSANSKMTQGGDVCNMANYEHIRFMKCMVRMENVNCPAIYQVQSSACDKYRETHKK